MLSDSFFRRDDLADLAFMFKVMTNEQHFRKLIEDVNTLPNARLLPLPF